MTEQDIRRFWSKVDVRGPDECWEWTAGKFASGYGAFSVGGRGGKMLHAHRVVLELKLGRPIARGMQACHEPVICHNRACCNPRHLYEGDNSDQQRDKVLDGTSNRGERCGTAKLTETQAVALLELRGRVTAREAARRYGLSHQHVSDIWTGKKWAHLSLD